MAAHGGIRDVAIVSAAALCVRSAVIIGAALRALEQRWVALAAPLARGLGLSVVSAAAVLAAQQLVAGVALPAVALAAGTAGALSVALVVLRAFPRLLGAETQQVVARVLPFVSGPWHAPLPATVPGGLPR
jgi:hypothetical protein